MEAEYNGEKSITSINGIGKTGQLHGKGQKLDIFLSLYKKINLKWIKDLNVGLDIINSLKENIEHSLT